MNPLGIYVISIHHPDLGTPDVGLVAAGSSDEALDLLLEEYSTPHLLDDQCCEVDIRGPYPIPTEQGILC
jgi:hypothetical protein